MCERRKVVLAAGLGAGMGGLIALALLAQPYVFGFFFDRYADARFGKQLQAACQSMGVDTNVRRSPSELIRILLEPVGEEMPGHSAPKDTDSTADRVGSLAGMLRSSGVALLAYANDIRSGKIAKEHGLVTYPPPHTQTGGPPIRAVTMDRNRNVYFILNDSHVAFNVGVIHRFDDSELLGDQQEPRISYTKRLMGDWWYCSSN